MSNLSRAAEIVDLLVDDNLNALQKNNIINRYINYKGANSDEEKAGLFLDSLLQHVRETGILNQHNKLINDTAESARQDAASDFRRR